MNGFVAWLQQLDFSGVGEAIVAVLASLTCIVVHESCHGLAALWLGDPTAKQAGRLSLNPIRHIDPIGLVMMAVFKFGWAKPVPVDMRKFKNPKTGMALTAAAGPLSNLLLALVAVIPYTLACFLQFRLGFPSWLNWVMQYLYLVIVISIGLAVFNVIPIPPLDGAKVLFALLPERIYWKLMRIERYGFLILTLLLLTGVLDRPLLAVRTWILNGVTQISWLLFTFLWNHFM